ncbi:carbohydrate ABC transporter permease [Nocardiopsis sp. N85]|uniref:carbohydrate ABC transporter permease n=1 Tax=Nocardiopsis sp. N85 TaxID=3029400 RepID=UPI00237FD061|nr:carbohydrate ABC transporter permease [Nocardiopsis sp. N85]MDE3724681.1 carbohydrate ABC transporter permease [Nocardiopsis sp. N85]
MSTLFESRPVWAERPSLPARAAKNTVLAVVTVVILLPIYVVVLTSLSPASAVNAAGGLVVVPGGISFRAYADLFSGGVVTRAVLVSLGVTAVGTLVSLTATILAAYGLSRPGSLLHRPLLFAVLLTFLFAPGMIPLYLLVSDLGLIDSYASLILPTAVNAFNLVVMRAFFMNLPGEIADSARIDGAGEWTILTRLVLPMSKGVTAVVGLFYAVGYWNAFFNAILYINDNAKWPLQLILRQYVQQGQQISSNSLIGNAVQGTASAPNLAVQMAIVVVALVPVTIIYPLVQKHFTKGVIIGAVKG